MNRPRAIKHIGVPSALCNRRLQAYLRDDLEPARYRRLGVRERFKGEKPYRVCKRCIRIVNAGNRRRWMR